MSAQGFEKKNGEHIGNFRTGSFTAGPHRQIATAVQRLTGPSQSNFNQFRSYASFQHPAPEAEPAPAPAAAPPNLPAPAAVAVATFPAAAAAPSVCGSCNEGGTRRRLPCQRQRQWQRH